MFQRDTWLMRLSAAEMLNNDCALNATALAEGCFYCYCRASIRNTKMLLGVFVHLHVSGTESLCPVVVHPPRQTIEKDTAKFCNSALKYISLSLLSKDGN